MFVSTEDQSCPHATSLKYIPQIKSETVRIDVPLASHDYYHTEANTDWFMSKLIEQLQVPTQVKSDVFLQ